MREAAGPTLSVERVADVEPRIAVYSTTHSEMRAAEFKAGTTLARLHWDDTPDEPQWKLDVAFAPGFSVHVGQRFTMTAEGDLQHDGFTVKADVGLPPDTVIRPPDWYAPGSRRR